MKKLLDMFDRISLPYGENAEFLKEKEIMELLKEYNPIYIEDLGIVIPSEIETKKVITSHYDLVRPFQQGFFKNEKFYVEDNLLRGALDNTLTNAFLILAIIELRSQGLAKDVEFVFTDGEESGMWGMSSYMRTIFPKKENPFFINLDVTNDNWNFSGSIEFDKPCFDICAQIETKFPLVNGYTHNRFADDTSAILRGGGNGFSFCIPTKNYCHTYQSLTELKKLEPYYEVLKYLISELDTSEYEHDLETLNSEFMAGVIREF